MLREKPRRLLVPGLEREKCLALDKFLASGARLHTHGLMESLGIKEEQVIEVR